MRSERLARALLRLYPRAWRERYGDEFLAFVADSQLSWRAVADVIFAATIERVRAVVALARHEVDSTNPLAPVVSRSVREGLGESGGFVALVTRTMWALSTLGVPFPPWLWWFNIVAALASSPGNVASAMRASWSERLVVSYFRFAVATTLTGLGLLTGDALSRLGVPGPSERTSLLILVIFFMCGGFRMLYCACRMGIYGSTWPGIHRREIHAWNLALFLLIVVLNLSGPPGQAVEAFWALVFAFWMSLKPRFALTRAAAATRRAEHEEMERRAFGVGLGGPQSPT